MECVAGSVSCPDTALDGRPSDMQTGTPSVGQAPGRKELAENNARIAADGPHQRESVGPTHTQHMYTFLIIIITCTVSSGHWNVAGSWSTIATPIASFIQWLTSEEGFVGECGGDRLCRRELVGGWEEAWERKGGSRGPSQLAMACCTDCAVRQCKGIYRLEGEGEGWPSSWHCCHTGITAGNSICVMLWLVR